MLHIAASLMHLISSKRNTNLFLSLSKIYIASSAKNGKSDKCNLSLKKIARSLQQSCLYNIEHRHLKAKSPIFGTSMSQKLPSTTMIRTKFREYSKKLEESALLDRDIPEMIKTPDFGAEKDVWSLLCSKDEMIVKNWRGMFKHRHITNHSRCLIVDWLMEVCSSLRLHRETFHLAVDYFDRYLCVSNYIPLEQLQCVATAGLLIASKFEEIYPPKTSVLSDYTDGAASTEDVHTKELEILQELGWNCASVTAVHWLAMNLQLLAKYNAAALESQQLKSSEESLATESMNNNEPSPAEAPESVNNNEPHVTAPESNPQKSSDESMATESINNNEPASAASELQQLKSSDKLMVIEPINNNESNAAASESNSQLPKSLDEAMVIESINSSDPTATSNPQESFKTSFVIEESITIPLLMRDDFIQLTKVIDLLILDQYFLSYSYRHLAAAVLFCAYNHPEVIERITCIKKKDIEELINKVQIFVDYCDEKSDNVAYYCNAIDDIERDDVHYIQTFEGSNYESLKDLIEQWKNGLKKEEAEVKAPEDSE